MRRRDFIALLSGAAFVLPFTATSQPPTVPVIGFLSGRSLRDSAGDLRAFRQGLADTGYSEGHNVAIDFAWADDNQIERLRPLAANLLRHQVAVIAAVGGNNSTLAAKEATATIPIVFTSGSDPTKVGLVESLNHPGGNVTGVSWFSAELGAKRLELLHELLPNVSLFGLLLNPSSPESKEQPTDAMQAASALGCQLLIVNASTDDEIPSAFATLVERRVGGILVGPDPFFITRRARLVTLAKRHALPAIFSFREDAEAGGLMSYGNSITDAYHQAGVYVGRILKGEKPGDLPVMRAAKFEFVINNSSAKALSLTIPQSILLRADEIID